MAGRGLSSGPEDKERFEAYEFFAQQYQEYLPRVLNYVRLRVGEEALAQDLTALAFERALARLHTLREEKAFGGWLFTIARRVVAGHYRERRPSLSLQDIENSPIPGPSPEGRVEQSEELEVLGKALASLSEREQEIIRLRFIASLANRDIARALGLREGNVAVILYRALRKVRCTLKVEDER